MRMRLILMMSLVIPVFVACKRDPGITPGQSGRLTFSMPAPKGAVTYAAVPGLENENRIDELYIYMFNQSEMLEYVYSPSEITLSGTGTSRTATIDVTGMEKGGKTFCFVANGTDKSAELRAVRPGATDLTGFRGLLTDRQTALLQPSLMMSALVAVEDLTDPKPEEKTVNLRRRVARFDVSNDASETNLEITRIMISGANLRGSVMADLTDITLRPIERGNLPLIDFNTTDFPKANTADPVEGVFYLYPTDLANDATVLSVEGILFGQTKIYTIDLPDLLPVLANYRYILKAKKMELNIIEWDVQIDEWEDGSDLEAESPGQYLTEVTSVVFTPGNGSWAPPAADGKYGVYTLTSATTPSTLKVTVRSQDKRVAKAEIRYRYNTSGSSLPVVTDVDDAVLTYAGTYTRDYTFTIPVQEPKVPLEAAIVMVNEADLLQRDTVLLLVSTPNYAGTAHQPVLFGGIYWAPVNVGATTVDATTLNQASQGLLFQWGRKEGWPHSTTPLSDAVSGPVSYESVQSGQANYAKFVKIDGLTGTDKMDWLLADDPNMAIRNNGWATGGENCPCPPGWRVPTASELDLIIKSHAAEEALFAGNRLEVPGDRSGEKLYIPATGYINYNSAIFGNNTIEGLYWSATLRDGLAYRMVINRPEGYGSSGGYISIPYGLAVRCVQLE